ncbi:MAG: hypothetical protein K5666_00855 [Bacilli bacterium]|nr:hypothetical protein [Bacilli bacterium]
MLKGTGYMLKPNNSTKFNDLSDKDIQTKLFVYSICKDMDTSVELQDGPVVIRDRIINLGEECSNINMIHPQDELFQDDAFNYLRRLLFNSINKQLEEMKRITTLDSLSNPIHSLVYSKHLLETLKEFEESYNSACDTIGDIEFGDQFGIDLLESSIILSNHTKPCIQRIITSHEAYHELKQNHKVMDYIQKLRRFY